MKKTMLLSVLSLLAAPFVSVADALYAVSCTARALLPAPTVSFPDAPQRRVLLEHGMPPQPSPTERAVRPQRDQRAGLRLFTLPRTDFAF